MNTVFTRGGGRVLARSYGMYTLRFHGEGFLFVEGFHCMHTAPSRGEGCVSSRDFSSPALCFREAGLFSEGLQLVLWSDGGGCVQAGEFSIWHSALCRHG